MTRSDNQPANLSSGDDEEASSEGSGSGSESEPKNPPPSSDESDSPSKRPAAAAVGGDLKRKKTVVAVAAPDADTFGEKKQLFQRLWSEENEIELIQGMIDYVEEKNKDPLADVNDFHGFVRKSLHVDVNDRQVLTKARRLKKKFENNAAKVVSKGKVRSFSNPHEKKMFELSKNLWGGDGNNNVVMTGGGGGGGGSKKVKVKVNVTPKTNTGCNAVGSGNGNVAKVVQPLRAVCGLDYFGSMMGLPVTDEVIMNKGLELASGAKRVELEAKWKSLKVEELEHFLKKVDVLKEQAEIVLDAIAKSGAK